MAELEATDRSRNIAVIGAAITIAAVLMVLNENDFDQVPATDTADVVATFAALGGAAVWFALRLAKTKSPLIQLLRAAAVGIAIGAIVIGLASVAYDPWAP